MPDASSPEILFNGDPHNAIEYVLAMYLPFSTYFEIDEAAHITCSIALSPCKGLVLITKQHGQHETASDERTCGFEIYCLTD